jgi:hypothetical protein
MKIARMLGATAVLFASLTLFGSPAAFAGSPMAFAGSPADSTSGSSSSGSSSSGDSSSGDSSSGDSSSGDSSSGDSSSSGHDSSGSSNSCDSDCQKKKDEKKKKDNEKKTTEPSTVVVIPRNPTPRAPVRQPVAVAPPAQDFVPPAPAETPVLEQDAVSRGFGELLPAGATVPVSDSTPTAGTAPGTEGDGEGDAPDAATPGSPANVQLTASSADSSPPWVLIGAGLAVGLLGAGLAFAPSKKPPLPPPPPMNHYPGY